MTEFIRWMAYETNYGPVTLGERLDILFAHSDHLFASAHRDRKKRRKFSVYDFLPSWWERPKPKQRAPSQIWDALVAAWGGNKKK